MIKQQSRDFAMFCFVLVILLQTPLRADEFRPEGLWLSEGYGYFIEVTKDAVVVNEVTAISCYLRAFELSKRSVEPDGSWRLTAVGGSAEAFLIPGTTTSMRISQTGAVSDIALNRTSGRPRVCREVTADTPLMNFEIFWKSFKEHYPIFHLKSVDWDMLGAHARGQISDDTTSEELLDILISLIAPLEDVHTGIAAEALEREFLGLRDDSTVDGVGWSSEVQATMAQTFDDALDVIQSRYIEGELLEFCNGHLSFGLLPDGLVYLRLDQESDYSDEPDFASQLAAMEEAMDSIFGSIGNAKGLIIDVRRNYGGYDILSLALASRLTQSPYFAYAKVARADPNDPLKHTPAQPRHVLPSSGSGFYGPVVQLIGPYTISAGETLTQALMGREPAITRVGENTQGVFSDTLPRHLPNGWRFWLPNELFLTEDGKYFDGPGIPPDVKIPVFRSADIEAGRDPALDAAIDLLSKPAP